MAKIFRISGYLVSNDYSIIGKKSFKNFLKETKTITLYKNIKHDMNKNNSDAVLSPRPRRIPAFMLYPIFPRVLRNIMSM